MNVEEPSKADEERYARTDVLLDDLRKRVAVCPYNVFHYTWCVCVYMSRHIDESLHHVLCSCTTLAATPKSLRSFTFMYCTRVYV